MNKTTKQIVKILVAVALISLIAMVPFITMFFSIRYEIILIVCGISAVGAGVLFFSAIMTKPTKNMDKSAIATVTNMHYTGLASGSRYHTNHRPQVELSYEFYTDTGMHIITKEELFLSPAMLSQMQVGTQLPILYQGNKPKNAAYDSERHTGTPHPNTWQNRNGFF